MKSNAQVMRDVLEIDNALIKKNGSGKLSPKTRKILEIANNPAFDDDEINYRFNRALKAN